VTAVPNTQDSSSLSQNWCDCLSHKRSTCIVSKYS